MSESWPKKYYRWPGYLPYPTPLQRSKRPVPNRSSVDSPQAQFAPLYLAPGSPSFQPYSFTKQDVPLSQLRPVYKANSLGNEAVQRIKVGASPWSMTARTGDLARLPNQADIMRFQTLGYGDGMAYELAPLQAAPHETFDMAGLDAALAGDCGCGSRARANGDCGCHKNPTETSSTGFDYRIVVGAAVGLGVLFALGYIGGGSDSAQESKAKDRARERMYLGGPFGY